jgi:cell division protein FtsB
MNLLMTIIVIAFILFILSGFAAVLLDQRAEKRHYEEMWLIEHQENEKLYHRIVELHQEIHKLKEEHLV